MSNETDQWRLNLSEPAQDGELLAPLKIGGYRLLRRLGQGGMGIVYEAVDEAKNQRVAVKLMRHAVTNAQQFRRFGRESKLLARLAHPNVARIFESGTHTEGALIVPYHVMELVESPATIIDHAAARVLSREARLRLMAQACDAVAHAHDNGILHRDIKPGNLLVGAAGVVKLIDLGVAKTLGDGGSQLTEGERVLGTIRYMSPEQLKGEKPTVESDVYALGVVLYELLLGRSPYESLQPQSELVQSIITGRITPPARVNPSLPAPLDAVLMRSLRVSPTQRYPSAAALGADVSALAEGRAAGGGQGAGHGRAWSRLLRWIRG